MATVLWGAVIMSAFFAAPYGRVEVRSVLPNPEVLNSRASESSIQIKRRMNGGAPITYVKSSNRETLTLRFILSRMKNLEISQFINAFHTRDWEVTLHDGSVWKAKLTGEPIRQSAIGKWDVNNTATGNEDYEVTFNFSAEKVA